MDTLMFKQDLNYIDIDFEDSNAYFKFVSAELIKKGYVSETFLAAIQKREKKFPTGLPIDVCKIAIPHCDSKHVLKPFISVTRLKTTLPFVEMGTDDHILNVKFIFLLGFLKHDSSQVSLLQKLINKFMDRSFVETLLKAKDNESMYKFLISNSDLDK